MPVYDMEEGACYRCQRCANCCRWPGEVVITDDDVERIASHLGMSVHDFVAKHTGLRANRSGLTLREKPNGECEFLDGNDCLIQEVKPAQCSGFPNEWNFPGWRNSCEAVPEFS